MKKDIHLQVTSLTGDGVQYFLDESGLMRELDNVQMLIDVAQNNPSHSMVTATCTIKNGDWFIALRKRTNGVDVDTLHQVHRPENVDNELMLELVEIAADGLLALPKDCKVRDVDNLFELDTEE